MAAGFNFRNAPRGHSDDLLADRLVGLESHGDQLKYQ
jgi:hypothetical protein